MKKMLLFFGFALLSFGLSAQVIFYVESPADVSGNFDLSYAEAVDGWGVADLNDPVNSVEDTLVFMENDSMQLDGCEPAINPADVEDQIAVVYRGDCQFGTKAFNAQEAGAKALVMINNTPEALIGLLGGDMGPDVTIPVILITQNTGEMLESEIENGTVTAFIGNKAGFFAYDLKAKQKFLLRPPKFSYPAATVEIDDDFSQPVGTYVYNDGSEDQTGVTVNATITVDGTEVYNETSETANIASTDSLFFSLPEFSMDDYPASFYNWSYTISSDNEDDFPGDNEAPANFVIDPDGLFTYGRTDQNADSVISLGGFQPASIGVNDDWRICNAYHAPDGVNLIVSSMSFSATATDENSIQGLIVDCQVLEWNDDFELDTDAGFGFEDVDLVASEAYGYSADIQGDRVTKQFEDPYMLDQGQRYLFCVQVNGDVPFIGYTDGLDYTLTHDSINQPLFPNQSAGNWFAAGFGFENVPAIGVNFDQSEGLNELTKIDIRPYPNPGTHIVTIPYEGEASKANLKIYDLSGKVVKSDRVNFYGSHTIKVDVNGLSTGTYVFDMKFNNGTQGTFRVVVSK